MSKCIPRMTLDAATALSTLQAENNGLKEKLYDGEGVNLVDYWMQQAKIEENGHRNCQAENEKLRTELERVKEKNAGLALALLTECAPNPDCLGDGEWRAIRADLEQVKRERDAIEQDFRAFTKQWWEQDSGFPCRWCKFEYSGGCEWKAKQPNEEKICAGRAFEWRGPQKED